MKQIEQVKKYFFLYAKAPEAKIFRALDLKNGRMVINLIYASMLEEGSAKEQLEYMQKSNEGWKFEMREIK